MQRSVVFIPLYLSGAAGLGFLYLFAINHSFLSSAGRISICRTSFQDFMSNIRSIVPSAKCPPLLFGNKRDPAIEAILM